jgi:hypothetical protein
MRAIATTRQAAGGNKTQRSESLAEMKVKEIEAALNKRREERSGSKTTSFKQSRRKPRQRLGACAQARVVFGEALAVSQR